MTKLVLFLAATAAIAGPALADTPLQFERDGVTYVGSISEHDGAKYITGHEIGSNRTFNLRVVNGQVTGEYGGDYVSYAEPKPARTASR